MKNKYLNKIFCITMISAMVLAIPTGVKAAEEADIVVAEECVSVDGSEVWEPDPVVPAEPVPTAAPEPEITAAPDPEPTTAPEPTATPAPTARPARDDSAMVLAVIRKIKALAGRTITAADKAEIDSVRAAYEALSNTEKAKVTN